MVDGEGRPLVVYHGTGEAFDAFKPASFFTSDRSGAEWYAGDRGGIGPAREGRVVEAYLSIKNPFDVRGEDGSMAFIELARRAGIPIKVTRSKYGWDFDPGDAISRNSPYHGDNINDLIYVPEVRAQLAKEGYDGLQTSDVLERSEIPTWIPLDPTQIKSVNNRGSFDPNNPNILADSDQPFSLLDDARRIAGEDQPDMFAGAKLCRSPPPTVDMQEPRPEPPPEGIEAAAARVGKPDDIKALAEQFGVDENGGFLEQADIDQLRAEGRLSADDLAELEAADRTYADTETYGEMLRAAVACVMN